MKYTILILTLVFILLTACQPLITNPEPKEPVTLTIEEPFTEEETPTVETPEIKPRDVGRLYDTYEDVPEICRRACEDYKEWEFQDECHQKC